MRLVGNQKTTCLKSWKGSVKSAKHGLHLHENPHFVVRVCVTKFSPGSAKLLMLGQNQNLGPTVPADFRG